LAVVAAIFIGSAIGCGEKPDLSPADLGTIALLEKQGCKVERSPTTEQEFPMAVTSVDFTGTAFDVKLLSAISSLTALKKLKLPKAGIVDADLKPLEALHELEVLDLSQNAIDGSGLRALRYSKLYDLNLNGTHIDDARMKIIGDIGHHLLRLGLAGTHITDAGLEELKNCGPIDDLDLSNTKIGGPGLSYLPKSVRRLNLQGTQVTDRYLASIEEMRELTDLDVGGTQITDLSLPYFQAMAEFQNRSYERRRFNALGVQNTQVSKEGIDRLRRSIPRLEVKQ
jgi:Leucine-rich repeat (LRR) protein